MFAGRWWTNILAAHLTVSWSALKLKMNPQASVKKTSCNLAVSSHRTWDTCSLGLDLLVIILDACIIFTFVSWISFIVWRAFILTVEGWWESKKWFIDIWYGNCLASVWHTHLLCSLLEVWDALDNGMSVSIQYHKSRHPVLPSPHYSCVCTWESFSSDFLQMLYECWKQMKHHVGAIDLKLFMVQKQWWFEEMDTDLGNHPVMILLSSLVEATWLIDQLIEWLISQLTYVVVEQTLDWPTDWLIGASYWLSKHLTEWPTNQLTSQIM